MQTYSYIPYDLWDYVTQSGPYLWMVYGIVLGGIFRFLQSAAWRKSSGK